MSCTVAKLATLKDGPCELCGQENIYLEYHDAILDINVCRECAACLSSAEAELVNVRVKMGINKTLTLRNPKPGEFNGLGN
jgi:ribosome-binding protein aMBF1 (putative translation factor)